METITEKLRDFFTRISMPLTAFQFSSSYLSGLFLSSKDKKIKSYFVQPLGEKVVEPSFYKKNITNSAALEKSMRAGLARLKSSEHKVIFLLPELSQKIFIFPFESLPPSPEEKEEYIRFKIKKQMPMMPKDNRIAFDLIHSKNKGKVFVSIAREAVIREYEEFFHKQKVRIKMAGAPSLGLINLLASEKEKDFALVNIEDHSFTMIVVVNSEIVFYRQKTLVVKTEVPETLKQKIKNIQQEIINTANFIEDKENRKISSLIIRLGVLSSDTEILQKLKERLDIPIHTIESAVKLKIPSFEKRILAPLIGQVL